MHAMQNAYRRSLDVVLRHQRATIVASIAMTALTIYLFVAVPKGFMPAVDVPYFSGISGSFAGQLHRPDDCLWRRGQ